MEFRPCIDIHNGKVKQIVGSSLSKTSDSAKENFVSDKDADYYADLYKQKNLKGGHLILLNSRDSEFYEETKNQAVKALKAYPNGIQVGGGIQLDNAEFYIKNGASHVIVTSFIFKDGQIMYDNLKNLASLIGKEHIVIDLSAKRYNEQYYIMTDRWKNKSEETLQFDLFQKLNNYCDEFLIHAVDVEGKNQGIDEELLGSLTKINAKPITYAGGIKDYHDITRIQTYGEKKINFTIGSALDLFGGHLSFERICQMYN